MWFCVCECDIMAINGGGETVLTIIYVNLPRRNFMKEFGLKLSLLVAVAALAGCADGATESSNLGECTESVCADATTLNNCVNGLVIPQTCDFGCVGNACVQNGTGPNPAGCTKNTCKDDKTLYLCMNGSQSEYLCPFGCANDQCLPNGGGNVNPPAPGACVADTCKDANVLLVCTNGVQQEVPCPYGCDNGACKTACTANVCKDAGTLLVCQNGVTSEEPCPAGCENGACKASCTADFCSDDKVLVVCGTDGSSQTVECPYGCANGKCNTMGGSCTDGARQCNGRDVEICEGSAWKTFETCANGCENNACKPSAGSCTDGDMQCSGNNVEVCENSAWKVSETCANGCENNACKPSTGSCTDGAKQCNGNNLEVCENSAWKVSETCANGCENNACKEAPSVDVCDYYDCTSKYGSECMKQFKVSTAVCDAESAYCLNRNTAGDSQCSDGETSWSTSDGKSYCLLVGKDDSCLQEADPYTDCGAEDCSGNGSYTCSDICTEENPASLAYCFEYDGEMYVGCGLSCAKEGDKTQLCSVDNKGVSYTYPAVCTKVGSKLIFVDAAEASTDYKDCSGACNAEGTDCAGGTTPACTNGATQCSGNFVQTCVSGNWQNAATACTNGCENGACKPDTGACTDNAKQCNGNVLQVCTNKQWKNSETCANGCENGACKEAPITVDWCDYYDCTSMYGSKCKSERGTDNAICDPESLYCLNRNASGDSQCSDGQTSWSTSDGKTYCLLVGSDEACLDVAWDCSAETLQSGGTVADACKADNASFLASCTAYGYGCGPACSTIGSTGTVCNDFGSQGIYTHPAVCTQVGDNKILVDSSTSMNDYTECANGCNAAGTGCASGGQTCTNGAKQCKGDYVQTCVSGSWQDAASACPNGCEAGVCKDNDKLEACQLYDCSSTYGSGCEAGQSALCYSGSYFCLVRESSKDSTCGSGKTAWSEDGEVYCLAVGTDPACLNVNYYCGNESCGSGKTCGDLCKEENPSFDAYCYYYNLKGYYGCGLSCSSTGEKGTVCMSDGEESYSFPAVCEDLGSQKLLIDASTQESDYTVCTGTCNAAGTACK